jgi:hypothetical protein
LTAEGTESRRIWPFDEELPPVLVANLRHRCLGRSKDFNGCVRRIS